MNGLTKKSALFLLGALTHGCGSVNQRQDLSQSPLETKDSNISGPHWTEVSSIVKALLPAPTPAPVTPPTEIPAIPVNPVASTVNPPPVQTIHIVTNQDPTPNTNQPLIQAVSNTPGRTNSLGNQLVETPFQFEQEKIDGTWEGKMHCVSYSLNMVLIINSQSAYVRFSTANFEGNYRGNTVIGTDGHFTITPISQARFLETSQVRNFNPFGLFFSPTPGQDQRITGFAQRGPCWNTEFIKVSTNTEFGDEETDEVLPPIVAVLPPIVTVAPPPRVEPETTVRPATPQQPSTATPNTNITNFNFNGSWTGSFCSSNPHLMRITGNAHNIFVQVANLNFEGAYLADLIIAEGHLVIRPRGGIDYFLRGQVFNFAPVDLAVFPSMTSHTDHLVSIKLESSNCENASFRRISLDTNFPDMTRYTKLGEETFQMYHGDYNSGRYFYQSEKGGVFGRKDDEIKLAPTSQNQREFKWTFIKVIQNGNNYELNKDRSTMRPNDLVMVKDQTGNYYDFRNSSVTPTSKENCFSQKSKNLRCAIRIQFDASINRLVSGSKVKLLVVANGTSKAQDRDWYFAYDGTAFDDKEVTYVSASDTSRVQDMRLNIEMELRNPDNGL